MKHSLIAIICSVVLSIAIFGVVMTIATTPIRAEQPLATVPRRAKPAIKSIEPINHPSKRTNG